MTFCDTGSKAMAGATWKGEVVRVQQDSSLPITSRCNRILEILKQNGLCYRQCIEPKMILVHVKNRGGQLVSVADVHSKGAVMAQIGFSMAKIGESICFELPSAMANKDQVIETNRSLAQLSQNQLCEPLGCERFASVSSSHLVTFLRAVQAGCKTTEPEISTGGYLSLDSMCQKKDDLKEMVITGWECQVIDSQVESACPELPQFLAQALNSDHAVKTTANELETACNIASIYELQATTSKDLKKAQEAAMASRTACANYIAAITAFVKQFTGGDAFPLLKLLQSIGLSAAARLLASHSKLLQSSHQRLLTQLVGLFLELVALPKPFAHRGKQYGSSTVWGQEFTELLAYTDFKCPATTYPWIRLAMAACHMCAPKQYIRDGISRLLTSADFSKLKQKGMAVQLAAAEKLLNEAWALCGQSSLTLGQQAQPMGRYLTRLALFLVGKGSKGPEGKNYKQFEDITDLFTQELMNMKAHGSMDLAEQLPSSSASVDKAVQPTALEARCLIKFAFYWCI